MSAFLQCRKANSCLFVLYSEAHVHTLIECVTDALEQQNSGTTVNDRYMKVTF